jgi:hypothetical protein
MKNSQIHLKAIDKNNNRLKCIRFNSLASNQDMLLGYSFKRLLIEVKHSFEDLNKIKYILITGEEVKIPTRYN